MPVLKTFMKLITFLTILRALFFTTASMLSTAPLRETSN
jgi:hypothetical protein